MAHFTRIGLLALTPLLAFSPLLASAQDSPQVARLEQEVRQLQREVSTLSQLVTQLRARIERPPAAPGGAAVAPPPLASPSPTNPPVRTALATDRWLDSSRWKSLKPGMSEVDVIDQLGPPTSARGTDAERVLFYALEIGPASFLAGSVTLRDHAVSTIQPPVLR
jgi:hypothetical protein